MDELRWFDCLGGLEDVLKRPQVVFSFGFPRQVHQDVSSFGERRELVLCSARREVEGVSFHFWSGRRHWHQVHREDSLHGWTRCKAGRNPAA
jgi:hypothetical protein